MKPRVLFVFTCWLAGMLIGVHAVADSSRNHWKRSDNERVSKSDGDSRHSSRHSGHGHSLKIKTWDREDSGRSRSSSTDDRDSRGSSDHRRSQQPSHRSPSPSRQAPPPRQGRTQHRPDHRDQDRDNKPPPAEHRQRDHRQPDHRQPDHRNTTPFPQQRDKDHRPERRGDDHGHDVRRPDHRRPDQGRNYRPRPDYKPSRPPRHDHRYDRRPKHHLYKRHKYIYYYTPWYNTWFLAPIIWHYHPIGYTIEVLPSSYIRIVVGGIPYFYVQGSFYRPYGSRYVVVAAPIGAVVTTLPAGYVAFSIGVNTYYYVNDAYYMWAEPRDGFVVVPKPKGADQAMTKATEGRLYAYPKQGQSEEQQAKDRYECHRWAVSESGVDPTTEEPDYTDREEQDYKRAIGACLEGRGYSVK